MFALAKQGCRGRPPVNPIRNCEHSCLTIIVQFDILFFHKQVCQQSDCFRSAFFVGGDGEIARDGEAGAGLVRDRRRGRMKGASQGRKQGVLEARSRAHQNDYVFEWVKKGKAFRLDIIPPFYLVYQRLTP